MCVVCMRAPVGTRARAAKLRRTASSSTCSACRRSRRGTVEWRMRSWRRRARLSEAGARDPSANVLAAAIVDCCLSRLKSKNSYVKRTLGQEKQLTAGGAAVGTTFFSACNACESAERCPRPGPAVRCSARCAGTKISVSCSFRHFRGGKLKKLINQNAAAYLAFVWAQNTRTIPTLQICLDLVDGRGAWTNIDGGSSIQTHCRPKSYSTQPRPLPGAKTSHSGVGSGARALSTSVDM